MNDTYGHNIGDQAILSISNAIQHCASPEAIPVRYGGDEFLVIAPVRRPEDIENLIHAIQADIREQARLRGLSEIPEISTSYVLTEQDSPDTLEDYVVKADNLMYQDKKSRQSQRE